MQEHSSRVLVGVDIGTSRVRVVVGQANEKNQYTITGVGEAPMSGVRKGVVVSLAEPAKAIDEALGKAERMAGIEIDRATVSVNGSSILSTSASGMIAVASQEVAEQDLARVEEVATVGKIPANREVLTVVAHDFILDGQSSIKDPIGMVGARLEINASVVSALTPHVQNLRKATEAAGLVADAIVVAPVAAAEAVLSTAERENGVAVVDLGAATTSMAIYEEGDLRFVAVIPAGSHNITNDLAIGLQTTPEIAEKVKLAHADAAFAKLDKQITVKVNKKNHDFNLQDIDEIIEARLEEILESVAMNLKKAGYAGKLPNGVVLTGGGANLRNIDDYTRQALKLAVRIAKPDGLLGLTEKVDQPEFATAVGLMKLDAQIAPRSSGQSSGKGFLGGLFNLFNRNKE